MTIGHDGRCEKELGARRRVLWCALCQGCQHPADVTKRTATCPVRHEVLRELPTTRCQTGLAQAELQCRPEIVPLRVHSFEQLDLTAVKRSNGSGHSSDLIQMPLSAVSFFIDLAQAPSAELSNCFQECVARRIAGRKVALHNRLLDERSKHLHDLI